MPIWGRLCIYKVAKHPGTSQMMYKSLILDARSDYSYIQLISSEFLKIYSSVPAQPHSNCWQRDVLLSSGHLWLLSKDQSSPLVYLNICIKFENLSSIGCWSCDRDNNGRKNPCHTKLCAFRCLISKSNSEVTKSNSQKITSFSKTTLLQRELFLIMFYTIKSSPLLVTK